ncbi:MAG: hypothetical protein Q9167_000916 [Letrouitia subvulpina]
MPSRLSPSRDYELVNRKSTESNESFDIDGANFEAQSLTTPTYIHRHRPISSSSIFKSLPLRLKDIVYNGRCRPRSVRRPRGLASVRRRPCIRRLILIFYCMTGITVALIIFTALFRPSYTKPPSHYEYLRKSVEQSRDYGRANPDNQKIFIAASIYDKNGRLVQGAWGQALLQLIDLLSNRNVYLSIYENDAGEEAKKALDKFSKRVQCLKSIVFERHVSLNTIPNVTLPDGSQRTKRIAYLAEMRNKALRPLDVPSPVQYDKVLFLNDVLFTPIDAVQLLFSTNTNEQSKASYLAACAVDFINPFKFYDTFATRDAEGYSMGVPFFPWFSSAGKGISREDVLKGKDAVRVKSCWGGMVAFDASYFQVHAKNDLANAEVSNTNSSLASSKDLVRFRAEPDLFWEASECCLVHADLQKASNKSFTNEDVGIYINPYVRVAYSSWTLKLLRTTRRIERLYTIPHSLINFLARMPRFNPRRTKLAGQEMKEKVWIADAKSEKGGSFQEITRSAANGGYCGFRTLQLIKEKRPQKGERNWETIPVPEG